MSNDDVLLRERCVEHLSGGREGTGVGGILSNNRRVRPVRKTQEASSNFHKRQAEDFIHFRALRAIHWSS